MNAGSGAITLTGVLGGTNALGVVALNSTGTTTLSAAANDGVQVYQVASRGTPPPMLLVANELKAMPESGQTQLRTPALLIVGALDGKYVEIAHRMAERIRSARVEVVGGAGHACHLERPEEVAHLLASW